MAGKNQIMVSFGIMGCARIARKICRAINLAPNATLGAIASRSLEKAEAFAVENGLLGEERSSGILRVYGSYIELLDDPFVDAVYMPLPTSLHVKWAVLAAYKRKHLLLEKPTALDSAQLEQILEACQVNGVQFMEGSMWYHHPRTANMKLILSDPTQFGQIQWISSTSSFMADAEFLENNIRVKPEGDALGALGDLGWYCIGAILWAVNYQLPTYVTALPQQVTLNSKGIILSCSASLHWDSDKQQQQQSNTKTNINATFYCSFLSHVSMDLAVYGSSGSIHVDDLAIPHRENSASFRFKTGMRSESVVQGTQILLPQEALMIQEFVGLVGGIKSCECCYEKMWGEISRKTQLVLDAVRKSIDLGFQPVFL